MDASRFEFRVFIPHDARFAVTIRELAMQAARYAGCSETDAEAFGRTVEEAIRGYIEQATVEGDVPVVVRRDAGPVEVLVDERTIALDV